MVSREAARPLPSADTAPARARRTPAARAERPATNLHVLQRSAGNHAVQRMLAGTLLQRACDCDTCERCQAKREHAHGNESVAGDFLSGKGTGQPLGEPARDFMESRFGHDFGQVRVHTDAHAARSAAQISAVAYTAGSDIFFAPGRYRPDTREGQHLLAHELTHVIQQSSGAATTQAQLTVGPADDSFEREADRIADAVLAQAAPPAPAAITPLAAALLQRAACVTGAFTGSSAELVPRGEAKAKVFKVDKWQPVRGWAEQVIDLQAVLEPAGGRNHCADAELQVFALVASATGSLPGALASRPEDPGTALERKDADTRSARARMQAAADEPALDPDLKLVGSYLPTAGGCGIKAQIAPGIRAQRPGERLSGDIQIVADLIDKCEPDAKPLARAFARVIFDVEVPRNWKEAATPQECDKETQRKGSWWNCFCCGCCSTSEPEAGQRDCVTGRFTSVPSTFLPAIWDEKRRYLGREFTMSARFDPLDSQSDCSQGEYRQFVKASWKRNGEEQGPSPEQPKAVTQMLVEDQRMVKGKDGATERGRYGYRKDGNPFGNSLYGPGDAKGACLFRGWDEPGMPLRESGEGAPLRESRSLEMKHEFVGQLIDLCRVRPRTPGRPFEGPGVLETARWWVTGKYPAETAPGTQVTSPGNRSTRAGTGATQASEPGPRRETVMASNAPEMRRRMPGERKDDGP
jgi:hypothetical protein